MVRVDAYRQFATKWIEKFQNEKTEYQELVNHYFMDDCDALSFKMDIGEAFQKACGRAWGNVSVLEEKIDSIDDIALIGSALYSKWRYYNHWAYDAAEICAPECRKWFVLLLERLLVLTERKNYLFSGILEKMVLISNNFCYGLRPDPEDEVKQRLTIHRDGRVVLTAYKFGDQGTGKQVLRRRRKRRESEAAEELLDVIAERFRKDYFEEFVTDVGDWKLLLANSSGGIYEYTGPLCYTGDSHRVLLSDRIRRTLEMDDLFAFDGNPNVDHVNRITIDYWKHWKNQKEQREEEWERLSIDREKGQIQCSRRLRDGKKVSHLFELGEEVADFLDDFYTEELFWDHPEPEGAENDSAECQREYQIVVDYEKEPQRVLKNAFSAAGLPEDFREFMEKVEQLLRKFGYGDLYDYRVYELGQRQDGDLIYLSVAFGSSGHSYYYLTEDEELTLDDYVVVPFGAGNQEKIGHIVNVEYFAENQVPFPLKRMKSVIRRASEGEIRRPLTGGI